MRKHAKAYSLPVVTATALGLALAVGLVRPPPSFAEKTIEVGGAPMYPSRTIIENAVNSKDHTTLVTAVKAAGLVDTLSGPGPFTVFAPVNEAFDRLPKGTVPTLLKAENKPQLAGILTYHVVPGRLTARDLAQMVDERAGTARLRTANGQTLTVRRDGKSALVVADQKGNRARVTIANVMQSNGVIHVIDGVMLPN